MSAFYLMQSAEQLQKLMSPAGWEVLPCIDGSTQDKEPIDDSGEQKDGHYHHLVPCPVHVSLYTVRIRDLKICFSHADSLYTLPCVSLHFALQLILEAVS